MIDINDIKISNRRAEAFFLQPLANNIYLQEIKGKFSVKPMELELRYNQVIEKEIVGKFENK